MKTFKFEGCIFKTRIDLFLLLLSYYCYTGDSLRHTSNNIEHKLARCQWLTPVILATQEAEIRRIAVQSQPWQIVHKTLSQKYSSRKIGLVE
jgi:hypothetical protein